MHRQVSHLNDSKCIEIWEQRFCRALSLYILLTWLLEEWVTLQIAKQQAKLSNTGNNWGRTNKILANHTFHQGVDWPLLAWSFLWDKQAIFSGHGPYSEATIRQGSCIHDAFRWQGEHGIFQTWCLLFEKKQTASSRHKQQTEYVICCGSTSETKITLRLIDGFYCEVMSILNLPAKFLLWGQGHIASFRHWSLLRTV